MLHIEKTRFQDLLHRINELGESISFVVSDYNEYQCKYYWVKDYNNYNHPRYFLLKKQGNVLTVTLTKSRDGVVDPHSGRVYRN